jgi:hypothetical protein
MISVTFAAAALAAALAASPSAAPAPAGLPWDGTPFAGEGKAIAAAAAKLAGPAGADVDVLLEAFDVRFDEAGRKTLARHLVAIPRNEDGVRAWSETAETFSPWFQDRPELRARVITRKGEARWLDAATLSEGAPAREGPESYSDRRVLRAPLPAVAVGAVVEERSVLVDREPFFAPGTVTSLYLTRPLPARRLRIRVEAPASLPLRHAVEGMPPPSERVEGGRRVLLWDVADLPAPEEPEPFAAPGARRWRRVALSTAPSWQAVAAGYAAIAERQLAGADLSALAREVVKKGDPPEVAAQKVLDFLASRVRYTHLALGEKAIVPVPPAETLERGYGDCKDLSLFAVGLLRAAGYPASLALLRSGGEEVDPALPGLGAFDHAIVKVGGKRPLFLDPTLVAPLAGELPSWLQGRLALEAAAGATALEPLPGGDAAANVVRKHRRIELADEGWARAFERTEYTGLPAADRRYLAKWDDAEAHDELVRHRLASKEGAEVRYAFLPAKDRRAAMALELSSTLSGWGSTREDDADAAVSPASLFVGLPDFFPSSDEPREGEDPPAREADLLLPFAFRAELRVEVVPAPGFEPEPLPGAARVALGATTLETTFAARPGGAVTVTHAFTLPRPRLTPAEVEALWRGIAERVRGEPLRVRFRRTSARLLSEGRLREALAELTRVAALRPSAPDPRNRLALALLRAGLVEPARRVAREATALAPGSEWSWRVLAATLGHDAVGRELEPGCDLPAAIAASTRARELDPESAPARGQLASFLEHAGSGERYGAGSRLEEALAERRHVHEELKDGSRDVEYARLLLALGRAGEARRIARAAPEGPARDAVLFAAAVAEGGLEGVQREAAELTQDRARAAGEEAGFVLLETRRYAEFSAFMDALAKRGVKDAAMVAKAFARARPAESLAFDPADPAQAGARLFQAMAGGADRAVLDLLAAHRRDVAAADARAILRAATAGALERTLKRRIPLAPMVDLLLGSLEAKVEGAGPWRVSLSTPALQPQRTVLARLYLVREEGQARIVAFEQPEVPGSASAELAGEALRAAEAGDLAAARAFLAWARTPGAARKASESSPVELALAALAPDPARLDREGLRVAAAAGAAYDPASAARALDVLERAAPAARDAAQLAAWSRAIAALRVRAPPRALAAADALAAVDPDPGPIVFDLRLLGLRGLGRRAEARALAERRLGAQPGDLRALRALAELLEDAGDHAGAARFRTRILDGGKASLGDWNDAAWQALFVRTAPRALERSGRALELPGGRVASVLHTRAAVLAAQGEAGEAVRTLRDAVAARGLPPQPHDDLVLGRVAQAYGLDREAEAYYRRAAGAGEAGGPISAAALARRWLAELGGPEEPAAAAAGRRRKR